MVASLIALQVSSAENERYCNCGNRPVLERSPCGGSFAARTTARASSAERTCGAMMPSAPASNTREMYSGVLAGTRTAGMMPASSAAKQICPVASMVSGECSRSM